MPSEHLIGRGRASGIPSSRGDHADGLTKGHALADLPHTHLYSANSREKLLLILAGLFVLVGAATLSLAELDHWSRAHWFFLGIWATSFGVAHRVLSRLAPDRDPLLLPLAGLLTGWGLLLIARLADVTFLLRQSIWLVFSVAIFLLIAARPPGLRWLRRYRYTWLLGGLALLAITLVLGTNPSGYGPRLWLGGRFPGLGGVYIQPSEMLKLLMVAYLSSFLAEKRELVLDGPHVGWTFKRFSGWRGRFAPSRWNEADPAAADPAQLSRRTIQLPALPYLAPLLAMWGLAMVLLAWQRDLGAALLFFLTFLVMLYQASGSWGYVAAGLILFLIASAGAYRFLDTVALRVDIWLNPWADPDGRAFQVVQSLIAFASGGLIGQGLGQGSPTYIPAIHTDFPFSAIAEEFGLIGIIGLIAAVAILTLRGLLIALNARTPFRRLLSAGLAALLSLQAWIIMAGNSKLIPLTGVTLPFVSYGGSSLLSSFVALALLTTISRDAKSHLLPKSSVMAAPIRLMSRWFLVIFTVLALVSGYWAVFRRDALWSRDDNPRLIDAEQRVRRGPILDRDSVILARSQAGEGDIQTRTYFTPTVPAVGYYSLIHGVGGVEASADRLLRGLDGHSEAERFFDELLHRPPEGRAIALTLDVGLQQEIDAMVHRLGQAAASPTGETWAGAVVLIDVQSGALLALVSQPIYDPNTLDADWQRLESDPAAPLLNRATQGLYQPGAALQFVVVAAALEGDIAHLNDTVTDAAVPVSIDGRSIDCAHAPQGGTLAAAITAACPAPVAELGEALGESALEEVFRMWGLGTPPQLEIETGAGEVEVTDPRLAAVGQEILTVTPLHIAMVAATLGNEGVMPPPHLVLKMEGIDGRWQPAVPPGQAVRVIDIDLSVRLRGLLRLLDDGRVLGHTSLALAGTERPFHAWFMGLAPSQNPQYAVAVLLEHAGADGLALAEQIGRNALLAALAQTP